MSNKTIHIFTESEIVRVHWEEAFIIVLTGENAGSD